jgi:hypothetical protein
MARSGEEEGGWGPHRFPWRNICRRCCVARAARLQAAHPQQLRLHLRYVRSQPPNAKRVIDALLPAFHGLVCEDVRPVPLKQSSLNLLRSTPGPRIITTASGEASTECSSVHPQYRFPWHSPSRHDCHSSSLNYPSSLCRSPPLYRCPPFVPFEEINAP